MTTTPERTATLTSLVAAEIRAQMGRLDVRQSELARRLGENDQWVSTRLKGRTPINLNDLHRFAKALGLNVFDLMPNREEAGRAAPQAIASYQEQPVRRIDHAAVRSGRPRDNRPSGHPGGSGPNRTARISRERGPK